MPSSRYEKYKDTIKANNARLMERRRALLAQYPCAACGNTDPSVIQWHHVDPTEKETNPLSGTHSENKFWDEVLKCVPLCANCHVKIHRDLLCLLPRFK